MQLEWHFYEISHASIARCCCFRLTGIYLKRGFYSHISSDAEECLSGCLPTRLPRISPEPPVQQLPRTVRHLSIHPANLTSSDPSHNIPKVVRLTEPWPALRQSCPARLCGRALRTRTRIMSAWWSESESLTLMTGQTRQAYVSLRSAVREALLTHPALT